MRMSILESLPTVMWRSEPHSIVRRHGDYHHMGLPELGQADSDAGRALLAFAEAMCAHYQLDQLHPSQKLSSYMSKHDIDSSAGPDVLVQRVQHGDKHTYAEIRTSPEGAMKVRQLRKPPSFQSDAEREAADRPKMEFASDAQRRAVHAFLSFDQLRQRANVGGAPSVIDLVDVNGDLHLVVTDRAEPEVGPATESCFALSGRQLARLLDVDGPCSPEAPPPEGLDAQQLWPALARHHEADVPTAPLTAETGFSAAAQASIGAARRRMLEYLSAAAMDEHANRLGIDRSEAEADRRAAGKHFQEAMLAVGGRRTKVGPVKAVHVLNGPGPARRTREVISHANHSSRPDVVVDVHQDVGADGRLEWLADPYHVPPWGVIERGETFKLDKLAYGDGHFQEDALRSPEAAQRLEGIVADAARRMGLTPLGDLDALEPNALQERSANALCSVLWTADSLHKEVQRRSKDDKAKGFLALSAEDGCLLEVLQARNQVNGGSEFGSEVRGHRFNRTGDLTELWLSDASVDYVSGGLGEDPMLRLRRALDAAATAVRLEQCSEMIQEDLDMGGVEPERDMDPGM